MSIQKKSIGRKVGCDVSHQSYVDKVQVVRNITPYLLSSFLYLSSIVTAQPVKFLPGRQVGTVQTTLIAEASGIVASRKNPEVLWIHNDSGNITAVYAVNPEGKLLGTYHIQVARCRDWEDIAIGPGSDPQQDILYIGDIGDNEARYPSITVYRVQEPKVDPNCISVERTIGPAEPVELVYPDGPKDAETLMVDPLNGDLYIISKRELFCRVYRAAYPQSAKKKNVLEFVTKLPWGLAVGGDVSPDGKRVVVRGVLNASLWIRPEGEPLWRAFRATHVALELIQEPQGEGICFDAAGRGYYTIGEMKHPPIYYFPALE